MNAFGAILRLARYRPWGLLLTTICWVGFYATPIPVALLLQTTVDGILNVKEAPMDISILLTAYGGMGIINILIIAASCWTWFSMELGLCGLMRRNMLEWLMTGQGSRRLPDTSGESLSRLRDDVREVALYFENYVDLFGTLVFTLGALVVMGRISPMLTGVVFLPLVGVVWLVHQLSFSIRRLRKARREATGRVTGFISECFSAVQSIKAANAEEKMSRVFKDLNNTRQTAAIKDQLLSEFLMSMHYLMFNLTLGLLLCAIGSRIYDGRFTVGNLVLFISFLPRLSHAISMIGKTLAQHRRTGVSIERMEKLTSGSPPGKIFEPQPLYLNGHFPEVPIIGGAEDDVFQTLGVQNISAHYPASGRGVNDVSFTLKKGEILAVTGRIAAGKSTLLKAILGIIPRDRGDIFWNGEVVEDPASFLIPPRCAYTPQIPWLFSDQLKYNIILGETSHPSQLEEAVQMAVLEPDIEHLEEGLETQVGPRGHKLSGGQVQRSSAARMFVREPSILIMDDLSSALDVETEEALWEQLTNQKKTCIIATHRRAALTMADQILVLKDGEVDALGTLNDLLRESTEMQALWQEDQKGGHP